MMRKSRSKKGFTLVELVIVIAVIAILAAVLIPTFSVVIRNANKSAARQEGTNLQLAIIATDESANFNDILYSLIEGEDKAEEVENVEGAHKLTNPDFVLNVADDEKFSTYANYKGDVYVIAEDEQEDVDDNQKKYYLEYTTDKGIRVQVHAQEVLVGDEIKNDKIAA